MAVNLLSGLTNKFTSIGSSKATSFALSEIFLLILLSGTKSLIIMLSPSALVHWKLVIESTLLDAGVCQSFFVKPLIISKLVGVKTLPLLGATIMKILSFLV